MARNFVAKLVINHTQLQETGVLNNKMGWESARLYRAMLEVQLEDLFNPNSISAVGYEKHSLMTADQWYRVADQPFDTAQRFDVKTEQATISLDPAYSYLVETRVIDGRKYLLIPAGEDVEVNGLPVEVEAEEPESLDHLQAAGVLQRPGEGPLEGLLLLGGGHGGLRAEDGVQELLVNLVRLPGVEEGVVDVRLRESGLKDGEIRETFYRAVIDALDMGESNWRRSRRDVPTVLSNIYSTGNRRKMQPLFSPRPKGVNFL